MTRLHEQLHKETTPEEQTLTLTMLSDEAKQRLIELLKISPVLGDRNMWICKAGQRHCKIENVVGSKTSRSTCWGCEYFLRPEKESCWIEGCNSKKLSYPETEAYRGHNVSCSKDHCQLKPSYDGPTSGQLKVGKCQYEWDCELEKLCTRGNFIIGYIDIYYDLRWTTQSDLVVPEFGVWPGVEGATEDRRIIVECKPEVKTFQGVLRQIKTYMDVFPGSMGVIATYSELPSSVLEILLKENVHVLRFPKPVLETPTKRNGLDNFKEPEEEVVE